MLDFNLNADSTQNDDSLVLFDKFPEASSGTSNSSIVNADSSVNGGVDDDSSSTRGAAAAGGEVFTFDFGILKVNDVVTATTKELFPMSAGNWKGQQPSTSSFQAMKSSVDLSLNHLQHHQGENGEMMKMVHVQKQLPQQPQQQVKKSRRGPRSRSSQYRGVTFYRRTGRWESHIWFAQFTLHTVHSQRVLFDIYPFSFSVYSVSCIFFLFLGLLMTSSVLYFFYY